LASIQIVPPSITSDDTPKMTCMRAWSRQVFSVAGIDRSGLTADVRGKPRR
jgi:hypothetical protein